MKIKLPASSVIYKKILSQLKQADCGLTTPEYLRLIDDVVAALETRRAAVSAAAARDAKVETKNAKADA